MGGGGGGRCKVIFVSNPTAIVDIVVGVKDIKVYSRVAYEAGYFLR